MESRILGPDGRPITILEREGHGSFALPPELTFTSILNSAVRAYYQSRWDEALRKDRRFAQLMQNDCFIMGLLRETTLAVTSLPWHLEVDDENDPRQVMVRDHLTKAVKRTPYLREMMYNLQHERAWYGRAAEQVRWKWADMQGPPVQPPPLAPAVGAPAPARDPDGGLPQPQPGQPPAPPPIPGPPIRTLHVCQWAPVSGDKIGHLWDGTPFINIYSADADKLGDAEIIRNDVGTCLVLRGSWRERFLIAHVTPEDADYYDGAEQGEARFGVGIRSKLFWMQWLRQELQGKVFDLLDRGVLIRLWFFELGNPQSEAAVKQAAKDQSGKVDIFIPRSRNDKSAGVENLPMAFEGLAAIRELLNHFEQEYIIPFIVGQHMSRDHRGSGGLGGSGAADMADDTKGNVTEDYANTLGEALTGSADEFGMIYYMQRYTFPDTVPERPGGFQVRFVIGYGAGGKKGKERLETIKLAGELVDVKADDVYKAAELTRPTEQDELAKKAEPKPGPFGKPGENGDGEEEDDGDSQSPFGFDESPDRHALDAAGHEHKGAGPGGGQFTGPGQGGRSAGQAAKAAAHPGAAHGSAVRVKVVKQRAFAGAPVALAAKLTKQETGRVGEAVALAYLRDVLGFADARPMNTRATNFPVDMLEDNRPTEVKAGLASNSRKAQQWRLTFSKESEKEKALYETMTPAERKGWNAEKQRRIHKRKLAVIKALKKQSGVDVRPRTLTAIINPDTRTADVYLFDGLHDRIDWQSDLAKKAYQATVRYE